MKIVTLERLCQLPRGTIFSDLHGIHSDKEFTLECRGLYRKEGACTNMPKTHPDFFFIRLTPSFGSPCEESWEDIGHPRLDLAPERWGSLDPTERFAIYESHNDDRDVGSLLKGISGGC